MSGRRGVALPAALGVVLATLLLGGAVATLVRTELVLVRQRVAMSTALATADACVARLVADLPAGWDFAQTLAGPDGAPGTADDGWLTAPAGCTATATAPPGPADPPRIILTTEARAGGGQRLVEAIAARTDAPGPPALLWLTVPPAPGAVVGSLDLDGRGPTDWAGLAAPAEPATLDAWVAGEAPRLRSTPGTGAPRRAPPPPLVALGERARVAAAGGVPGVAWVDGDLVLDEVRAGAGLLFVRGILDIRGTFDFTGVVAASGGIRVAAGGDLTVGGAAWAGAPPGGQALLVQGAARLYQDPAAVDAVDRQLELPRLARRLGVRDGSGT